jgi:hypothetical protein
MLKLAVQLVLLMTHQEPGAQKNKFWLLPLFAFLCDGTSFCCKLLSHFSLSWMPYQQVDGDRMFQFAFLE